MIIFPQIFIDILSMNCLELLHGVKLFDYFSSCAYRFQIRTMKWIPNNIKLDKSLNIQHRSLDNLCFSYQFYFISTFIIIGICFVTIGISIMIRNNYIFFADPVFFPLVFIFFFLILLMRSITSFALDYIFNFWKSDVKKEPKGLDCFSFYPKMSVGFQIDNMMEADLLRKHFVQYNKDWIIKNLKHILKADNFEDNDGYLLNMFQMLTNEAKKEEKEKRREEMLKKKMIHAGKPKKGSSFLIMKIILIV